MSGPQHEGHHKGESENATLTLLNHQVAFEFWKADKPLQLRLSIIFEVPSPKQLSWRSHLRVIDLKNLCCPAVHWGIWRECWARFYWMCGCILASISWNRGLYTTFFISETCFVLKLVWFIALTTPVGKMLQDILFWWLQLIISNPNVFMVHLEIFFIRLKLFILNSFSSLVFTPNYSIYLCTAILSRLSSFF